MKLVRFGPSGKEKPGIVDKNGKIRDLSKVVKDIDADALTPSGVPAFLGDTHRNVPSRPSSIEPTQAELTWRADLFVERPGQVVAV